MTNFNPRCVENIIILLQKQGSQEKVDWGKNAVSYFQHVEFEKYIPTEVPRKQLDIED